MYTEQLEYFKLAYDMKSFSAAAKQVPMSSQGLTKSIRALESELGVELFAADKTGTLKPTAYADALMDFTRTYDNGFKALSETFEHIRATETRTVRLGASLGIIGLLGHTFLDGFRRKHPDVIIEINEENDAACDEHLKLGATDLALTLAPFDRDFDTEPLFSAPICFWVPVKSALGNREKLTIADLDGKAIALPGKDFKCYRSIIDACSAGGVEPKEIVPSSEIFWLYEYAVDGRGLGFSVGPHADLPMFQISDKVRCVPLEGFSWTFGLSRMSGRALETHEQSLHDYLVMRTRKLQER